LGIPIIQGRDFDPNLASDSAAFIVNEKAVRALGLENPIGVRIKIYNDWGTIIGVTPDYHIRSLHNEISPLAISRSEAHPMFIYANITSNNIKSTLDQINGKLKEYDPTWDISGRFINEFFEGRYRREEKLNKLFIASSLLAITIAIMGLLALTFFFTSQRTKEVGIRKTLGANTLALAASMAWSISRWVIVSCLIGLPLAWYFINEYMLNFAYSVNQNAWVFILTALGSIVLAMITIMSITIMVARENPVIALRYE
jgi:putative ABC transport system permease protein